MEFLAICSNAKMDIAAIWDSHLRAIVDELAPGTGRGVKRPAFRAIAEATRKNEEYVYQVYTGKKHVGQDFAESLDRIYAKGRPPGWINISLQEDQHTGASNEPAPKDTSNKEEGLGLIEFLSYLNSLYPGRALTPEEIKEEASAYEEFAAKRVANRVLKQRFKVPGFASDAAVEAAYGEAQRRERRGNLAPDQQLVNSPLEQNQQRRSTDRREEKK